MPEEKNWEGFAQAEPLSFMAPKGPKVTEVG